MNSHEVAYFTTVDNAMTVGTWLRSSIDKVDRTVRELIYRYVDDTITKDDEYTTFLDSTLVLAVAYVPGYGAYTWDTTYFKAFTDEVGHIGGKIVTGSSEDGYYVFVPLAARDNNDDDDDDNWWLSWDILCDDLRDGNHLNEDAYNEAITASVFVDIMLSRGALVDGIKALSGTFANDTAWLDDLTVTLEQAIEDRIRGIMDGRGMGERYGVNWDDRYSDTVRLTAMGDDDHDETEYWSDELVNHINTYWSELIPLLTVKAIRALPGTVQRRTWDDEKTVTLSVS